MRSTRKPCPVVCVLSCLSPRSHELRPTPRPRHHLAVHPSRGRRPRRRQRRLPPRTNGVPMEPSTAPHSGDSFAV
eukprot:9487507-Pyramimonas_sp.AAC.1